MLEIKSLYTFAIDLHSRVKGTNSKSRRVVIYPDL